MSLLTDLFSHEPWLSYAKGVAINKINLKPEVAFLRAIPANALVCAHVCAAGARLGITGLCALPLRMKSP